MKQRQWQRRQHFTPTTPARAIPPDIWLTCPGCRTLLYRPQLAHAHNVCPHCAHHLRMTAREWIALLLDPGSFQEQAAQLAPIDALDFSRSGESYQQTLRHAAQQTGVSEALTCGSGTIADLPVEIAIANFEFLGGSMGSVYGERLARSIERAISRGAPLVTVNASGGARMQEGILALMQMAKLAFLLRRLAQARQIHIAVLVDPCYGGVCASYASAADVLLAEPGAQIGFAGPRVIEQTIGQTLPPDFQKAEALLEYGMIDAVVPRGRLRATLTRVLRIHASIATPASRL